MKLDLDYMAKLMAVFTQSPKAMITIQDIEDSGIPIYDSIGKVDDTFYFHFLLLAENGLISDKYLSSSNLARLGISSSEQGISIVCQQDIRLTQAGNDFASALENKGILSQLKNDFTTAPFKVLFEVSQKLLEHYLKKKVDELSKVG